MKIEYIKKTEEKEFDTVKTFREIKDKISFEMKDMNFEKINAYLKKNRKSPLDASSSTQKTAIIPPKLQLKQVKER